MKTKVAINGNTNRIDSKKYPMPADKEEYRTKAFKGLAFLAVFIIALVAGSTAFSGPALEKADSVQNLIQNTDSDTDNGADSDKDANDKDTGTTDTEEPTEDYEVPADQ